MRVAPDAGLVPDTLLRGVVEYFHPQRVILIGSRARGTATEGSDYDLLVILDDDAPAEKVTLKAGYESRAGFPHACDVMPCRASTFARRARIVGTVSYAAREDGVVVYER